MEEAEWGGVAEEEEVVGEAEEEDWGEERGEGERVDLFPEEMMERGEGVDNEEGGREAEFCRERGGARVREGEVVVWSREDLCTMGEVVLWRR